MKLASYKDGSRDGQLVVVSRDLAAAHYATGIATRLQAVLDDWNFLSPQLQDLYASLNGGHARHAFPFDPALCMAPLPRAAQWVRGAAYPGPAERLRGRPEEAAAVTQGSGDAFLGPCDDIALGDAAWGLDLEAGFAVVTGEVAAAATPAQALDGVRLVMLVNDAVLRELGPRTAPLQARPGTAFAPVAVTPEELGAAWQGGRVRLTLRVDRNGEAFARADAGTDMALHFGELIASVARTRRLRAGSIVGSGPVGSLDAARGAACIGERRALESREGAEAVTAYLQPGETVRIEAQGSGGAVTFGAIEQRVTAAGVQRPPRR